MKSLIKREKDKRERAERLRHYAKNNWNIKKKEIEEIFHDAFDGFTINGNEFYIDSDLNSVLSEKHMLVTIAYK